MGSDKDVTVTTSTTFFPTETRASTVYSGTPPVVTLGSDAQSCETRTVPVVVLREAETFSDFLLEKISTPFKTNYFSKDYIQYRKFQISQIRRQDFIDVFLEGFYHFLGGIFQKGEIEILEDKFVDKSDELSADEFPKQTMDAGIGSATSEDEISEVQPSLIPVTPKEHPVARSTKFEFYGQCLKVQDCYAQFKKEKTDASYKVLKQAFKEIHQQFDKTNLPAGNNHASSINQVLNKMVGEGDIAQELLEYLVERELTKTDDGEDRFEENLEKLATIPGFLDYLVKRKSKQGYGGNEADVETRLRGALSQTLNATDKRRVKAMTVVRKIATESSSYPMLTAYKDQMNKVFHDAYQAGLENQERKPDSKHLVSKEKQKQLYEEGQLVRRLQTKLQLVKEKALYLEAQALELQAQITAALEEQVPCSYAALRMLFAGKGRGELPKEYIAMRNQVKGLKRQRRRLQSALKDSNNLTRIEETIRTAEGFEKLKQQKEKLVKERTELVNRASEVEVEQKRYADEQNTLQGLIGQQSAKEENTERLVLQERVADGKKSECILQIDTFNGEIKARRKQEKEIDKSLAAIEAKIAEEIAQYQKSLTEQINGIDNEIAQAHLMMTGKFVSENKDRLQHLAKAATAAGQANSRPGKHFERVKDLHLKGEKIEQLYKDLEGNKTLQTQNKQTLIIAERKISEAIAEMQKNEPRIADEKNSAGRIQNVNIDRADKTLLLESDQKVINLIMQAGLETLSPGARAIRDADKALQATSKVRPSNGKREEKERPVNKAQRSKGKERDTSLRSDYYTFFPLHEDLVNNPDIEPL